MVLYEKLFINTQLFSWFFLKKYGFSFVEIEFIVILSHKLNVDRRIIES